MPVMEAVSKQRRASFVARSDSTKVAFSFVTFLLAKQKKSKEQQGREKRALFPMFFSILAKHIIH